jgi:rare lipoprotein A
MLYPWDCSPMKSPVNRLTQLALISLLGACGGGAVAQPASTGPVTGPAADFPMVIGEPFVIDGVTHTPNDRLNYDAVGYAALGEQGGSSVSVAHRTMPLPSYLEVTALDTGKTILVRVERRGPMTNARLVELSPGAAAQLGIAGNPRAPVRIRRVNPPEVERAALRSGQAAPARMDTPKSLLAVLTRKLDQQNGVILSPPVAAPTASASGKPPISPAPARPAMVKPSPTVTASPALKPAAPAALASTGSLVQVAAFSTEERAKGVAAKLGAQVTGAGRIWRVRMGPYATAAEAQAALAKARAAGYSDARILRAE